MTLNDIIDLNLLNRFLTNLRSLFATKSEVAAKPTGKIYYGTCSTTANTYIKEATVETFPLDENDKPLVGTVVAIKYSVSNTYKTEGQTYALNVNNTGAYPMYYNNAAVATSTSANTLVAGYKNRHVFYVFNGTQWVWLSASYDTNTTYSGMTQAEVDAGTGTTARLITPARLRDNFYTEGEVDTLLGSKANSNDLATVATSGSYNDLENKPTIPTKTSDLTNDGDGTNAFLTQHQDLSELTARIAALESQMIPHFQITTMTASGNGETLSIVIIDNTSLGWTLTAPSGITLSSTDGSGITIITAVVAASDTLEPHTFNVQMYSAGEIVSTLTIQQAVPEVIITASLSGGTLSLTPNFANATSGSAALEATMVGTTLQITSGGSSEITYDDGDLNIE